MNSILSPSSADDNGQEISVGEQNSGQGAGRQPVSYDTKTHSAARPYLSLTRLLGRAVRVCKNLEASSQPPESGAEAVVSGYGTDVAGKPLLALAFGDGQIVPYQLNEVRLLDARVKLDAALASINREIQVYNQQKLEHDQRILTCGLAIQAAEKNDFAALDQLDDSQFADLRRAVQRNDRVRSKRPVAGSNMFNPEGRFS